MSTRCNIIIKDRDTRILLYHHHDGYPEGVGAMLKDWLKERDNPYSKHWDDEGIATALVKRGIPYIGHDWETKEPEWKVDDEYECASCIHDDVVYAYVINCWTKTLRCFRIPYYGFNRYKMFKREHLVDIPDAEQPTEEELRIANSKKNQQ